MLKKIGSFKKINTHILTPIRNLYAGLDCDSTERIWGTLKFFIFLLCPVLITEYLFRRPLPRKARHKICAPLEWKPGLSILIPHRGPTAMLAECLDALEIALKEIDEPYETLILFNDTDPRCSRDLCKDYPWIKGLFFAPPLGFTSAVKIGLSKVANDCVYLLNNDMILDRHALREVLAWRSPYVFAIASQIFFPPNKKREETGWTTIDYHEGIPYPRHIEPEDDHTVRGTVYAGAGSSLFHRRLLAHLVGGKAPFDPFYWEDTDWSTRAWRMGYEVLFCPASRALHKHRATVSKYYPENMVNRVFERNRVNFTLRNPFPALGINQAVKLLLKQPHKTLAELGTLRGGLDLFKTRIDAWRAPFRDIDIARLHQKCFLSPPGGNASKPPFLIVTPFAIYPPAHGGAVRSHMIIKKLAEDFSIILASDEADLYNTAQCRPWLEPLSSIHFVGSRPEKPQTPEHNRIRRIREHCHRGLELEIRRLMESYRPRTVMLEHMELGGLVSLKQNDSPPFILDLHDVLLEPGDVSQAAADRFETGLMRRFDALVVCCEEDRRLLPNSAGTVVPNGFEFETCENHIYTPSSGSRNILFAGPLRCRPNLDGIRLFLRKVWPRILDAVEGVSFTLVGGPMAAAFASKDEFSPGRNIRILEYAPAMRPLLDACAVTINPHVNMRGSSLKLIESIAAGRVCVSTQNGARGFLRAGFTSLITTEAISDFGEPLIRLLLDEEYRLSLEIPDLDKLSQYTWKHSASKLKEIIVSL